MKVFFCATLILLLSTASGFATVIITSPSSGADVASSFNISANASTCSSQPVVSMGYSFDNSTDTTVVNGTYLNAQASAGNGPHTLHVKAWGDQGAGCVTDVAITVSGAATASVAPSDAVSISNIESLSNWIAAVRQQQRGWHCKRQHEHRQFAFAKRTRARVCDQLRKLRR